MDQVATVVVRGELTTRRKKLESALVTMGRPAGLVRLLDDVDLALERLAHGTYGLCETCHDPIEPERLAADPLLRFCIDHLNRQQREALEEDLALASRVQQGLLPENHVARSGWEISYHYQPAGPVGGDYCDLLHTPDDLVFLVGDASGKGVASSLLASHLHAAFHSLFATALPLDQILRQANRVFCESTLSSHYATLACGRATPAGEIEIASAGHCQPLHIRAGDVVALEATGLPLGLFCGAEFTTHRLRLDSGDWLLLYSDGLIEARNSKGSDYGMERLCEVSAATAGCPTARQFAAKIVKDWDNFRGNVPPGDDLTLMVLRRA